MRLFSFGGYGLALAALALMVFGAYDSYPNSPYLPLHILSPYQALTLRAVQHTRSGLRVSLLLDNKKLRNEDVISIIAAQHSFAKNCGEVKGGLWFWLCECAAGGSPNPESKRLNEDHH